MTVELDRYGYMIGWRERRDRLDPQERPEVAALLRWIMERLDAPRYCRRKDCRRAASCRAERVDCAFQHLDLLQDHVFPILQQKARAHCAVEPSNGQTDEAVISEAGSRSVRTSRRRSRRGSSRAACSNPTNPCSQQAS